MERRGKDKRKEVVMTNIEGIIPKGHLLRKIEKIMDYGLDIHTNGAILLHR